MDLTATAGVLLFVLLIVLAAGLWIGLALLVVGALAIGVFSPAPVGKMAVTTIWGNSADWTLTALPMFIWMGEILYRSRMSQGMFEGLVPWFSRIPGRLLHVGVAGCVLFGAVSGSSTATCATISQMTLPELRKRGYPDNLIVGSLASAGTLGILIPPSLIMIVYAVAADVSIIQLFLAGIIPGLMIAALFSIYIIAWSLINPSRIPVEYERRSLKEKLKASTSLAPCLALIAGVFVGMFSGVVTATEVATLGVVGAMIIAALFGTLTWQSLRDSTYGALRITCMIGLILLGSNVLSAAMALTGIPAALAEWVRAMHLNPYLLIGALCLVYLLLGTALEGVSMILLTTSVALPMVQAAGFDPIWFGVFIVVMTELSTLSPPVGFNLFVVQVMSGRDSNFVALATLPFFILLIVAVGIMAIVPEIVTWLPTQVMRK
jgi:C4-dicarboxylate transporter, DctM subunit